MTVVRSLAPLALFVLGVAIVASAPVASAQGADKAYVIRFPESSYVGETYKMEVEARQVLKRDVREGERIVHSQEDEVEIKFDSRVKVLEVTERRQEAATHYTVDRAVVITNGAETEILAPGTEFRAAAGKEEEGPIFTLTGGGELPKIAQQALPRVISFDRSELTMDKLFGSDTPRNVGQPWEIEKKTLVALAKEFGTTATEEGVEGRAKIERIYEQDGQTLLDLVFEITIEFEEAESPVPQAEPMSAKLSIVQKITMRENSQEGPMAQSFTTTMHQLLRGKEGTPLEGKILDGQSTESRTSRYKRLPE